MIQKRRQGNAQKFSLCFFCVPEILYCFTFAFFHLELTAEQGAGIMKGCGMLMLKCSSGAC